MIYRVVKLVTTLRPNLVFFPCTPAPPCFQLSKNEGHYEAINDDLLKECREYALGKTGSFDNCLELPNDYKSTFNINHYKVICEKDEIIVKPPQVKPPQVSEAAAVKARWLGNFCPRQPVHRALKRLMNLGFISLTRAGPLVRRKFNPVRVHRPRRAGPLKLSQSGSSASHRAGLQQRSLRCVGFHGPQPAGPARELKLLARVHRAHSGPASLLK
jgi:hypothetical protein